MATKPPTRQGTMPTNLHPTNFPQDQGSSRASALDKILLMAKCEKRPKQANTRAKDTSASGGCYLTGGWWWPLGKLISISWLARALFSNSFCTWTHMTSTRCTLYAIWYSTSPCKLRRKTIFNRWPIFATLFTSHMCIQRYEMHRTFQNLRWAAKSTARIAQMAPTLTISCSGGDLKLVADVWEDQRW